MACEALNKLSNDETIIYLVIYDTQALEISKSFLDVEHLIDEKTIIDITSIKPENFENEEKTYSETISDCKIKIEELYEKIYST